MILGRFGPGWPLLFLAAAFAVHGLSTRRVEMWVFLSFPLLYISFMTGRPAQFPRWVYPLVPFVAVAGASGLVAVIRVLRARASAQPRGPRRVFVTCVTAALVAVGTGAARLERSRRLQSAADAPDSRARREVAGGERGAGRRRAPRNPLAGSSGVEASCQTSRESAGRCLAEGSTGSSRTTGLSCPSRISGTPGSGGCPSCNGSTRIQPRSAATRATTSKCTRPRRFLRPWTRLTSGSTRRRRRPFLVPNGAPTTPLRRA